MIPRNNATASRFRSHQTTNNNTHFFPKLFGVIVFQKARRLTQDFVNFLGDLHLVVFGFCFLVGGPVRINDRLEMLRALVKGAGAVFAAQNVCQAKMMDWLLVGWSVEKPQVESSERGTKQIAKVRAPRKCCTFLATGQPPPQQTTNGSIDAYHFRLGLLA